MKLIRLTGGLGNQMFIYAFYLAMKKRFPSIRLDMSEIVVYKLHNGYELNNIFNIEIDGFRINKILKKIYIYLLFKKVKEHCENKYFPEPYTKQYSWPNIYYKGYFQSELFFEEIITEVCKAYTFDLSKLNKRTRSCAMLINKCQNSVSIHIRRGDFFIPKNIKEYGNICTDEYYRKAVHIIEKNIPNPEYFIFSDDINWVQENLKLPQGTYVDWNKDLDSWQDMFLMSECKHNIIANSSFSWWGAWLNKFEKKIVIAPSKWFNTKATPNIHPVSWTII